MIGQGVLRESLLANDVEEVAVVGRSATGQRHGRLREYLVPELHDLSGLSAQLSDFDACFFCLGVSAAGLTEVEYSRVTFDLTLSIARLLLPLNPAMTFVYVSGAGTDSSERSRLMWARVKGKTENALRQLPFRAVYLFRPGLIRPLHGIQARTPWYRVFYRVLSPVAAMLGAVAPTLITSTEELGRVMLAVARRGFASPVLEMADIRRLALTGHSSR